LGFTVATMEEPPGKSKTSSCCICNMNLSGVRPMGYSSELNETSLQSTGQLVERDLMDAKFALAREPWTGQGTLTPKAPGGRRCG